MSKFSEAFGKLKNFVTEFSNNQLTSLNGILDKVPAEMKSEFTKLRDALQMKKTEIEALFATVPGDDDAATALQSFFTGFTKLREHTDSLMTSLQSALTARETATVALQGLEKKVTDGLLISKENVKGLTDAAHQQGIDSVMPQLLSLRKESIALAGLPDAPEAVLKLPGDQFKAAITIAQANVKKLGDDFGFALQGKGESWIKESAWLDGTAFNGQVTKIKDLLPKPPANADPLLGGVPGAPAGSIRFA